MKREEKEEREGERKVGGVRGRVGEGERVVGGVAAASHLQ